jgi:predicted nucleic acid-binding protein
LSFVLDGSIPVAFIIEDERTVKVAGLMNRAARDGCVVPSLWRLEVANALRMAIRRRRLTQKSAAASLMDLEAIKVEADTETDHQAWTITWNLAARHNLTLYDAAYLELAGRRGLPLASLDAALRKAAHNDGVEVL